MKAVVVVLPDEGAMAVARLIGATLSMNGYTHDAPAVINWPMAEPGAVKSSPDSAAQSDSAPVGGYDESIADHLWPETTP